jgi:peptidoglycan-associated lipoprotein
VIAVSNTRPPNAQINTSRVLDPTLYSISVGTPEKNTHLWVSIPRSTLLLNEAMKQIVPIVILAAFCGCHTRHPIHTLAGPKVVNAEPDSQPPTDRQPAPERVDSSPHEQPASEESLAVRDRLPPRRDPAAVIADLNNRLEDAFFDYDRSELRSDALAALRKDAALLAPIVAEFPQFKIVVEGHCDERGSAEYNLGLGDHRANRAAAVLQSFGVPLDRIQVVSYGKEQPQCSESTESCWHRNRRAHLAIRIQ